MHQKVNGDMLTRASLWLYPNRCLVCQEKAHQDALFCQYCLDEFPRPLAGCTKCLSPLPASKPNDEKICGSCLKSPPSFDNVYALWCYEGVVKKLIHGMKFSGKSVMAHAMGKTLAAHMVKRYEQSNQLPGAIIPVPISYRRHLKRGFNQSVELAKPCQKALGIPIINHLVKKKHTEAQAQSTNQNARRLNLKGVFGIKQPYSVNHVILVDDVMTTGATAESLCQLLKANGVKTIDLWCVARTPN